MSVRLYAGVARRSFRRWSTDRAATLAGIFTNSTFGFIRAAVLLAVVKARPGVGGFDPASVVTFSFLTQGLLAIMSAFGDDEIALRIRSGDVVTDLYRPADFQAWWFQADVGRAAFQPDDRSIPIATGGPLASPLGMTAGLDQAALRRRAAARGTAGGSLGPTASANGTALR